MDQHSLLLRNAGDADPARFTTDEPSLLPAAAHGAILFRRLKARLISGPTHSGFADRLPPEAINLRFGSAESSAHGGV